MQKKKLNKFNFCYSRLLLLGLNQIVTTCLQIGTTVEPCHSMRERKKNFINETQNRVPKDGNASSLSSLLPALALTFRRDCAESFKLPGTLGSGSNLSLCANNTAAVEKARQHLHFPQAIDKGVSGCGAASGLSSLHHGERPGVLRQRVGQRRLPSRHKGCPEARKQRKTSGCHPPSSTHQGCPLFDLLTSGRRYGSLTTRTIDWKTDCFQKSISALNSYTFLQHYFVCFH